MSDALDLDRVLVVVPALNEELSIAGVIDSIREVGVKVVVVSDGSTDETARIARDRGAVVLELPINLGVGGALRTGFRFAIDHGFGAVVQVDADGQHPATEIPRLLMAAHEENADMVVGSRFLSDSAVMKVTGVRRLAMRVLSRSASAATGTRITDSTSGFRLIRQPLLGEFARHFANNYLGDTYEAVVSAGRAGYRVIEIPATLTSRAHGESTASTGSAVRFTLKGLGVAMLGLHKRLRPVGQPRR